MQVLIIGATGTIGSGIVSELKCDCELVEIGNSSGQYQVDITSTDAIAELYKKFPDTDAVVCAAARDVVFAPLSEMSKQDYWQSLQAKQLGQIDLVLQGIKQLKPHVCFTLTTGLLNYDPIATATAAGMVNGAIEGFARAAAIDMPAQQRINVVSPGLLVESVDKYRDFFPGYVPVPAATVALAYRKSIMGKQTGQVMRIGW